MTTRRIITGVVLFWFFSNVISANVITPEHRSLHLIQNNLILIGRRGCSVYYKSHQTASWPNARDVCRNCLGPNATLVNVETVHELRRLYIMLDDVFDRASSFWVDAQWMGGCYKWLKTGKCVDEGNVVHWFNDRPFGENKMRLLMVYEGMGTDITFTGATVDNNAKFICEVSFEGETHCNDRY